MFKYAMLIFATLVAGTPLPASDSLNVYLQTGLRNNLALASRQSSYEESLAALRQARGMFLPAVQIEARYSRARGGRDIIFPVGDLFNPIYSTLNDLLAAQGGNRPFPENLQNEVIPFLREKEQETKLRLVQPVFQPALLHNYKLHRQLSNIRRHEKQAFGRELVSQIKSAYFSYQIAARIITVLNETQSLLQENLRISESLFANQRVTRDVVYRAQAEISALRQQLVETRNQLAQAGRYVNFLLNRDASASITVADSLPALPALPNLEELMSSARLAREELHIAGASRQIARHQEGIAKSSFLPGVTFVLDYGIQGESYNTGPDDDFWMASLLLQWNLFNGFQDRARMQQAKLQGRRADEQLQELQLSIALQVREKYDNVRAAAEAIDAALDRQRAASQSFVLISKKFEQGIAPQIEFLDARTNLTEAQVNLVVTRHRYHISFAELERVAGLHDLDQYPGFDGS